MKHRNVLLLVVVLLLLYAAYWKLFPYEGSSWTKPRLGSAAVEILYLGNNPVEQVYWKMNPVKGHTTTASWAPQRGPQIIRRPTGPGFRTVEVDMAQIRWAESRVHAYEEGTGDIESYNRARTLLEETGWWGMAGPHTADPPQWGDYSLL